MVVIRKKEIEFCVMFQTVFGRKIISYQINKFSQTMVSYCDIILNLVLISTIR